MVMDANKTSLVIILQYINISNHCIVYLQLIQYFFNYISIFKELLLNKKNFKIEIDRTTNQGT